MAKELPYFRFYPIEWIQGDVTMLSMKHQGLFINVCALYWSRNGEMNLNRLYGKFKGYEDELQTLIEEDILIMDTDDNISISFLDEQLEVLKNIQKAQSEGGRKGGLSTAKGKLKETSSYKYKDKYKDKEGKSIDMPTFSDFKDYALEKKPLIDVAALKLKYDSWVENGWKDGHDNKILNWKTKLLNTLPYIGEQVKSGRKEKSIIPEDYGKISSTAMTRDEYLASKEK